MDSKNQAYLYYVVADELSVARISELQQSPIKGEFDIEHLQKVHAHIFQDEAKFVLNKDQRTYQAGELRAETDAWHKVRLITEVSPHPDADPEMVRKISAPEGIVSPTFYSRMSDSDIKEMADVLNNIDVKSIKEMNKEDAGKFFAKLYGDLDYIHPFYEGNTRTIQTFTQQLAKETGFKIDWEDLTCTPKRIQEFYVARDKSLGEKYAESQGDEEDAKFLKGHREVFRHVPSLEQQITSVTEKRSLKQQQTQKQFYQTEFGKHLSNVRREMSSKDQSQSVNKNQKIE